MGKSTGEIERRMGKCHPKALAIARSPKHVEAKPSIFAQTQSSAPKKIINLFTQYQEMEKCTSFLFQPRGCTLQHMILLPIEEDQEENKTTDTQFFTKSLPDVSVRYFRNQLFVLYKVGL